MKYFHQAAPLAAGRLAPVKTAVYEKLELLILLRNAPVFSLD
jgi:hypothetical protein